jgi:hypothetical protein
MRKCRVELVFERVQIGEMAHMIDRARGGPARYENLILLCGNCHKAVDDEKEAWPPSRLARVKSSHERWVARQLAAGRLRRSRLPQRALRAEARRNGVGDRIAPRLQSELRRLRLTAGMQADITEVLRKPNYPKIMSITGHLVPNPVWDRATREALRLAAKSGPLGRMPPSVLHMNLFLVKADDGERRPCLLTYLSRAWGAYFFPFRRRAPGEADARGPHLDAADLAAYFGIPSRHFRTRPLGAEYAVSVKPDPDYRRIVLYIFEYRSVTVVEPPAWFGKRTFERHGSRFRWWQLGDLRVDPAARRVNGDVVRAIHQSFATTLPRMPFSVPRCFLARSRARLTARAGSRVSSRIVPGSPRDPRIVTSRAIPSGS